MNLEERLNKEYSLENIERVAEFINENPDLLRENIELMLFGETKTAQKASWVFIKFNEKTNLKLVEHLDYIIDNLGNDKHVSVYRSLARYFSIISNARHIGELSDRQIDFITDFCFSRLINKKEKAAIRAFSMNVLKNISFLRPWIRDELILFVENNMANSLPSFKSVGKKVLKELK